MATLARAIISTLIYYDLLDRPLTELETYKYLLGLSKGVSFFDFQQALDELVRIKKIGSENGLFFLPERSIQQKTCHSGPRIAVRGNLEPESKNFNLDSRFHGNDNNIVIFPQSPIIKIREKRLKSAQVKWKKLKKLARWLALVPFLRLAAVTGSLTAYNTRLESDFDLLIVAENGRLWLTRTLITGLCSLLRARRHDQFTQDRICLNCYLTEDSLEIKPQAKPRDFHSAQEYGRLTPILEIEKGLYQKFLQENSWLNQYLNFYPWPNNENAKKITTSQILSLIRKTAEWLFKDAIGDWLEKTLNSWQIKRINQKIQTEPLASRLVSESERALRDRRSGADQIYISNQCLMFHPHSKSYQLMQNWQAKIKTLTN